MFESLSLSITKLLKSGLIWKTKENANVKARTDYQGSTQPWYPAPSDFISQFIVDFGGALKFLRICNVMVTISIYFLCMFSVFERSKLVLT